MFGFGKEKIVPVAEKPVADLIPKTGERRIINPDGTVGEVVRSDGEQARAAEEMREAA